MFLFPISVLKFTKIKLKNRVAHQYQEIAQIQYEMIRTWPFHTIFETLLDSRIVILNAKLNTSYIKKHIVKAYILISFDKWRKFRKSVADWDGNTILQTFRCVVHLKQPMKTLTILLNVMNVKLICFLTNGFHSISEFQHLVCKDILLVFLNNKM